MKNFSTLTFAFFLFGVAPSFADGRAPEAEARENAATFLYDRNPGGYDSFGLGLDLAFADIPRFLFDLQRDRVPRGADAGTSASNLSLGIGADFSPAFTSSLRLHYVSLPGAVYARGGEIYGRYKLGELSAGLGLKVLHYSSDRTAVGRRLRESGIPERSARLNLNYSFTPAWSAHAGGVTYSYGGATPSELAEVLAARSNVSAGLLSVVEGFPKRSISAGLGWRFSDEWDLDLTVAGSSYELAPNSTSSTLTLGFDADEHWNIALAGTRIRQDGVKTGGILGLQVTYAWE